MSGDGDDYDFEPEKGWRPIDTAPKDGETALFLETAEDGTFCYTGYWNAYRGLWLDNASSEVELTPSHWMPLPPPPPRLHEGPLRTASPSAAWAALGQEFKSPT